MSKLLDVGPLELEVLGCLNESSDMSVSAVQTALKKNDHDLAYTTVMTVLSRLYAKKLVSRKKDGRMFLYSAVQKHDSPSFKIFEKVKNSLFRSEKLKPIMSLIESDENLSRDELLLLKKAIETKLKGN